MERINSTEICNETDFRKKLHKIDLTNEKPDKAGVVLSADKTAAYVDTTDSHTIVFGATGSKKTRMVVMPTIELLKKAGESYVVTDPKGEIYSKTAGDLEALGYEISVINFRDFESGESWNPLLLPYDYYNEGLKAKAVELSGSIADLILSDISHNDPYWANMARDVLIGLMILLYETTTREKCNIKSVFALWNFYRKQKTKFNNLIHNNYGNTIIDVKLSCLDNASDRTVGSIEAVVVGGINKLTVNEEFIEFLSQNCDTLEKVTQKKAAVYLIVPDENRFYHMAASLYIEQMYEELIRTAQNTISGSLSNRVNFIIDEFANLPTIENMDSMITASRSRNIRFMLIVQSMGQLNEKYRDSEIILSNCNNWIYLYSKEYNLLEQISKLCGTVIYDNGMHMPLFSEFDLQHLDKEKGEALILSGRNYPCLVNLMDIDEYPFKRDMRLYEKRKLLPVSVIEEKEFTKPKGNSNRKAFFLTPQEIKETEAARVTSFTFMLEKPAEDPFKNQTWLVATYKDVIVREWGLKDYTDSNKIMIYAQMINEYGLEAAGCMEWYYTDDEEIRKTYCKILEDDNPELAYLTVKELEKHCKNRLVKAESPKKLVNLQSNNAENNELFRWNVTLALLEDGVTKIRERMFNEIVSSSALGKEYITQKAFRLANEVIKNSRYEEHLYESTLWKLVYSKEDDVILEKNVRGKFKARLLISAHKLDEEENNARTSA